MMRFVKLLMKTEKDYLRSISEKIKKSKKVILATHEKVDGDALGGLMALYLMLRKTKKEVVIASDFKEPLWDNFRKYLPKKNNFILSFKPDLAIFVDYGNKNRLHKKCLKIIEKSRPFVITIDHHERQTQFGDIVWIDKSKVGVCEMIFDVFSFEKFRMNPDINYFLLLGIIGDSKAFSYYPLTKKMLVKISKLTTTGEEFMEISHIFHKWNSLSDLRDYGKHLSRARFDRKLSFAYVLFKKGDGVSNAGKLASDLVYADDVNIALCLKKTDGFNKGDLRGSKRNKVDLSRIAGHFGGGGHFNASGFKSTLSGAKIVNKVKELIREQKS